MSSRRQRILVHVLVGAATVVAFVSTLTVWIDRQLLDNNAWNNASEELIQDPAVQQALSVYLVNQLYDNVDVAGRLRARFPANLDPLAGPAAQALRAPAANAVGFMLARPRVQDLWVNASTRTHQKLLNVLENKTGDGITAGNGVVTLNVSALLKRLTTEIGLPGTAASALPPDAATITVLRSAQLGAAQRAVETTRVASRFLLILVVGMYALAAYLARGNRRRTIRTIGWALVGVGLAVLVVRKLVGNYVVDTLASPEYRGTGHRVWLISTSLLGDMGWAAVFYGAAFVLAMTLAGGSAAARAARRHLAPIVLDEPALTWGGATCLVLALVLWGGTHALRTWWGIGVAAVLIAMGVVALRRQLRAELVAVDGQLPRRPAKKLVPT